jgi:hypothetical protein
VDVDPTTEATENAANASVSRLQGR